MARMLPERIRVETRSHAEHKLYEAFAQDLPNDFTVFHSVSWLARDSQYGTEDREADFIIAHPDLGVLVLEVKGGAIRYDGIMAQWFSNDIEIKDPVYQVRRAKYSLLDLLKGTRMWQNRWITLGHAVAFPDVAVNRDLLPDLPATLVLDAYALDDLAGWVQQAMEYWHIHDRQVGHLGQTGIDLLCKILSPSWDLRPLLSAIFEDEEAELVRLTEEQFYTLDVLQQQQRALVSGCAGSGKTMLALEQSRRLAEAGFQVLLTCFNRNLADRLCEADLPPGVEVNNFHRLGYTLIREAGLQSELEAHKYKLKQEQFFIQAFPELLTRAAEILGPRYNALIVDEGQDFYGEWFLALDMLLDQDQATMIYVFKDDNQNLFHPRYELPWELPTFTLTRNCRNTRHIHDLVTHFYYSARHPTAPGPEGRQPEVLYYQDERTFDKLMRSLLHRLLVEEQLHNADIIVLSPRQWGHVPPHKRYGNFILKETWSPASGEVSVTTVQSFKGLESPVIILAGMENDVYPDPTTIAYVGMSRARNHLVVLAHESLSENLKRLLVSPRT